MEKAAGEGCESLDSVESNGLLSAAGINIPAMEVVGENEVAQEFATNRGYPVVLKLNSPLLLHKTEVGGIWTNIYDDEELNRALEGMWQRRDGLEGQVKNATSLVIQEQVDSGVEVIVGVKKDPSFGSVLMFGAGGTLAELVKDRNLFVLPMSHEEAVGLIEKSIVGKLLTGYRGAEAYDLNLLAELMVGLAGLAESSKVIAEIEINPVIVTYEGVWAVDGKTVLRTTT